ncbi:hypothetical protein POTOM_022896 [Populus tomentosa]|uniref:Uncharacterized protein n=1 Tax=Populus tomentosa TaxID=118781 RepID=A0A8X7ZPB9_POPTO|nr:hypothetical protein POTOM_022896 [Populus tomentosa]
MSSFTNFDNLLLQTLMGRLQIHPPPPQYPFLSQSLEDLLFNVDDSSDDDDTNKTQLSKEESKLEKEIIRVILSGKTDSLKPNSGQAVTIGEHHICVGFHEEKGSDYRVWEWHGHIMLFDEEDGYTPEYIYGNYFERLLGNLGLRELIDGGDSGAARILHRIISAGSPRFQLDKYTDLDGRVQLTSLFRSAFGYSSGGCTQYFILIAAWRFELWLSFCSLLMIMRKQMIISIVVMLYYELRLRSSLFSIFSERSHGNEFLRHSPSPRRLGLMGRPMASCLALKSA